MAKILFVEDDPNLIQGLSFALRTNGYTVCTARNFNETVEKWKNDSFDLVILDISLPDGSGYDLCRIIRQSSSVPVLFLSAADEETDVIMGLDLGGDDYMTKPFKLAVFLSRIRALLRRSQNNFPNSGRLRSHDIVLDLRNAQTFRNGKKIDLTSGEYRLLRLFMEHPDQVLSPEQILGQLWDHPDCCFDTNTASVYIRRLRLKIEDDPSHPAILQTVRGLGYCWKDKKE